MTSDENITLACILGLYVPHNQSDRLGYSDIIPINREDSYQIVVPFLR